MKPTVRRLLTAAAASAGLLAFAPPGAASAQLVPPAPCSISTLSQPFLAWSDTSTYELVPGGDFENLPAGWSLQGGAAPALGSETFAATGTLGSSSVELPQGAVAAGPPACMNIPHPDARLFVRSGSSGATLKVVAVYNNGQGPVTIPAGSLVQPTSTWEPTPRLDIHPIVIPALHSGDTALITLRFTATKGTVYIDDVYVDPWGRF